MDDLKQAIGAAFLSADSIPREHVRQWIRMAEDIETDALLYRLTGEAWHRIEPRLEMDETCLLIQRYLLGCIREDPKSTVAHTRYGAAGELERWFDHLAERQDTYGILRGVAAAVTELFLNGDTDIRDAIETGFLEHVLEQESLRPWFRHWEADERLRGAWQDALAWGEAHPDFMKTLRAQLRATPSAEE